MIKKSEIEKAAKDSAIYNTHFREIDLNGEGALDEIPCEVFCEGFTEGALWYEKQLAEMCGKGFEEYLKENFDAPTTDKQSKTIEQMRTMWQAATLAAEMRHKEEVEIWGKEARDREQEMVSLMSRVMEAEKVIESFTRDPDGSEIGHGDCWRDANNYREKYKPEQGKKNGEEA